MEKVDLITDVDILALCSELKEQRRWSELTVLLQEIEREHNEKELSWSDMKLDDFFVYDEDTLLQNDVEGFCGSLQFSNQVKNRLRNHIYDHSYIIKENCDDEILHLQEAFNRDFIYLLINKIVFPYVFSNDEDEELQSSKVRWNDGELNIIASFCEYFESESNYTEAYFALKSDHTDQAVYEEYIEMLDIPEVILPVALYWIHNYIGNKKFGRKERIAKKKKCRLPEFAAYLLQIGNHEANLKHNIFYRYIKEKGEDILFPTVNLYLFNLYSPIFDIQFYYNKIIAAQEIVEPYVSGLEDGWKTGKIKKETFPDYYGGRNLSDMENAWLLTPTFFQSECLLRIDEITEDFAIGFNKKMEEIIDVVYSKISGEKIEWWLSCLCDLTEHDILINDDIILTNETYPNNVRDKEVLAYINKMITQGKKLNKKKD